MWEAKNVSRVVSLNEVGHLGYRYTSVVRNRAIPQEKIDILSNRLYRIKWLVVVECRYV